MTPTTAREFAERLATHEKRAAELLREVVELRCHPRMNGDHQYYAVFHSPPQHELVAWLHADRSLLPPAEKAGPT
jgi:muconolactone delta-isomerase